MGLPWRMLVEPPDMGCQAGGPGDAAHYGLRQPRWATALDGHYGLQWVLERPMMRPKWVMCIVSAPQQ
jgi:hypothetical protein